MASNKRRRSSTPLENDTSGDEEETPIFRSPTRGYGPDTEARYWEDVNLADDVTIPDFVASIQKRPGLGTLVHQIRYRPLDQDPPTLSKTQADFVAAQVTLRGGLDPVATKRWVRAIQRLEPDATFCAILLLCPNLRVLQIEGPTIDFGRYLRRRYGHRQQARSEGQGLPPIDILDLIDDRKWGSEQAWPIIRPYFFIPGLHSILVEHFTFKTLEQRYAQVDVEQKSGTGPKSLLQDQDSSQAGDEACGQHGDAPADIATGIEDEHVHDEGGRPDGTSDEDTSSSDSDDTNYEEEHRRYGGSLTNVYLEGVRVEPEELAEVLQRLRWVEDLCYEDYRGFFDFERANESDSRLATRGVDRFKKRLEIAAQGTLRRERRKVSWHAQKIFVRGIYAKPSTRCGFGPLSRPLPHPSFGG